MTDSKRRELSQWIRERIQRAADKDREVGHNEFLAEKIAFEEVQRKLCDLGLWVYEP